MIAGKPRPQRGFTLLELLVTMAVATVLITIAMPGFNMLTASNRQTAIYNDILSAFRLARSEAITQRKEVTVQLTNQDNGWHLKVEASSNLILYRRLKKEVTDVSNDLKVVFDGMGRRESCEPAECQVVIGSEGIEIWPAGEITKSQEGKDENSE